MSDAAGLLESLTAAGGPTGETDFGAGRFQRGPAGSKPQVIPFHLKAVLSGAEANPILLDYDTVYLPAKPACILITVSAIGELPIEGIVCPEDQLETRLKELAARHPEAVTIRPGAAVPMEHITRPMAMIPSWCRQEKPERRPLLMPGSVYPPPDTTLQKDLMQYCLYHKLHVPIVCTPETLSISNL